MSANSHNTLGLGVKVDDKRYYIFPNAGNNAENNIIRTLSMKGVDKNSTYFIKYV